MTSTTTSITHARRIELPRQPVRQGLAPVQCLTRDIAAGKGSGRTVPAIAMRRLSASLILWCAFGCALLAAGCGGTKGQPGNSDSATAGKPENQKIVTLGGTVTEIVYALGAGGRIVGTDISSTYPESARKLPQVGYQRTIAAEQVLSLNPTLVLATEDAGPPAAMEQLKNAGIRVEVVHGGHSMDGIRERITEIARITGTEQAGRALIDTLGSDMAHLAPPDTSHRPRVVYVHARGGNGLQVSGTGTAADAIIAMAGGVNAVTAFPNYKPLTPEAAIGAAPDVILVSREGFEQLGGAAAIAAMPGIAQTPAGRTQRIVPVDDLYMLGFGPRAGKACVELAGILKGGAGSVGTVPGKGSGAGVAGGGK